jgi:hypothetical protein
MKMKKMLLALIITNSTRALVTASKNQLILKRRTKEILHEQPSKLIGEELKK